MIRVILIRPGTTEFDEQGRILGTLDVPLSERGSLEVTDAVDELSQFDLQTLYTSTCESARQTSDLLSDKLAIKSKSVDLLKNVDHGLWQGMLVEEVKRKQPKVFRQWKEHPETVCAPEGEMLESARQRVESFLGKLFKKHKSGTIGIVAPDPLAGLIESYLLQTDVSEIWKRDTPCGSWTVIELEQPGLIKV